MKKPLLPALLSLLWLAAAAQSPAGRMPASGLTEASNLLGPAPTGPVSSAAAPAPSGPAFYYSSSVFATNANAGDIPLGPFNFRLNNPTAFTSLSVLGAGQYVLAGAWASDTWYGALYPDNLLVDIDTVGGSVNFIGNMTPLSGELWTGLSYDKPSGVLYAVSASGSGSTLYTVDPATGTVTVVGAYGGVAIICLAANSAGTLYGVDILADQFGTISKTDGSWTPIGSIGFDASYGQDMEFDLSTDSCFYAAYNFSAGQAEMRSVDIATGATTMLGAFPPGSQIVGFVIPDLTASGIGEGNGGGIAGLRLYPNPAGTEATLSFTVTKEGILDLEVTDLCGRRTNVPAERRSFRAGTHRLTVNVSGLQPGIYLMRLNGGLQGSQTGRLIVAR